MLILIYIYIYKILRVLNKIQNFEFQIVWYHMSHDVIATSYDISFKVYYSIMLELRNDISYVCHSK